MEAWHAAVHEGHKESDTSYRLNNSKETTMRPFKQAKWFSESVESVSPSVTYDSFQPQGLQPARLLCPWDSPGNNTGVGCHALLQGIFPTQRSNPNILDCRQILYHLSLYQGSLQQLNYFQDSIRSSSLFLQNRWICFTHCLVSLVGKDKILYFSQRNHH